MGEGSHSRLEGAILGATPRVSRLAILEVSLLFWDKCTLRLEGDTSRLETRETGGVIAILGQNVLRDWRLTFHASRLARLEVSLLFWDKCTLRLEGNTSRLARLGVLLLFGTNIL